MSDQEASRGARAAGDVRCPRCGAAVPGGSQACPACALPLRGRVAAQLWALDQQMASLVVARTELLRLLASSAGPPGPSRPASGALLPAAVPSLPPGDVGGLDHPSRRRFGAQQLLLVTGVVLVAVAASIFAAAVWHAIGVLGQAVVLLAVCAAAATASRVTARRALTASAEALAILAVLVLGVAFVAARSLDLFGLGEVRWGAYDLAALLGLIGACALGDARLVARPAAVPRAYAWVAVLLSAAVPTAIMIAVRGGSLTFSAAALVLAVCAALAAPRAQRRVAGMERAALVIAAVHLVGGVLTLFVEVVGHRSDGHVAVAALDFVLLAGAAHLVVTRTAVARPLTALVAQCTTWAAVGGAVLAASVMSSPLAMPLLACALAAAVSGVLLRRARLPWAVLVAAQGLAGTALLAAPLVGRDAVVSWLTPTAWALLALAGWLTGERAPVRARWSSPPVAHEPGRVSQERIPTVLWLAGSAVCAVLAPLTLPGAPQRWPRLILLLVVGAALLMLGARRRALPEQEGVLVCAWAVASAAAWVLATDAGAGSGRTQIVMVVSGVAAIAYAALPRRTPWCMPGALLVSTAWWVHLAARPPAVLEGWTVPPALLLLVIGALVRRRVGSLSSWSVLGPGLLLGLTPSVAWSLGTTPHPWRPVVVLAVAVALCALGVQRAWQAALACGALAALVVALGQLWVYAVWVPLWASLGLAGLVVLVLAIRVEQARRDAARAVQWLRALH